VTTRSVTNVASLAVLPNTVRLAPLTLYVRATLFLAHTSIVSAFQGIRAENAIARVKIASLEASPIVHTTIRLMVRTRSFLGTARRALGWLRINPLVVVTPLVASRVFLTVVGVSAFLVGSASAVTIIVTSFSLVKVKLGSADRALLACRANTLPVTRAVSPAVLLALVCEVSVPARVVTLSHDLVARTN
jgi:hypothetical protein